MYAFSISAALQKVKIDIRRVPENPLIVQPPADHELGNAAMYHYTWGATFLTLNDTKVFEFDKRVYVDQKDVHEVREGDVYQAVHNNNCNIQFPTCISFLVAVSKNLMKPLHFWSACRCPECHSHRPLNLVGTCKMEHL